jgi:hypothetical protein
MHTFQGISVDAGVTVDGDCTITHTVCLDGIEFDFGHRTGSLHLCMTEDAAIKLVHIATVALDDFRQHRATTDRSEAFPLGWQGTSESSADPCTPA